MMRLLQRLLGGRPMTPAPEIGAGFRDRVNGRMVLYFVDYRGRFWMAHTRWSWFRVPCGRHSPAKKYAWQDSRRAAR